MLCQRGLHLGRRKVNQPECHQHGTLPTSMSSILHKGKSTSMVSNSELEQADLTATICLLTTKYGHTKGSTHAVVGETPSRFHWLLQSGHCVHKDHKGIGWEWASQGPIPTGGRVDSLSSSSNSSTSGGKQKCGEPDPLTSNAPSLGS